MTTKTRKRYLILNRKRYLIKSKLSDEQLSKHLIDIIKMLLKRKTKKKTKSKTKKSKVNKSGFVIPFTTGGPITQEQIDRYKHYQDIQKQEVISNEIKLLKEIKKEEKEIKKEEEKEIKKEIKKEEEIKSKIKKEEEEKEKKKYCNIKEKNFGSVSTMKKL
jgi:hypothetical protein